MSKFLFGELISVVSHESSLSRSLPRSIYTLLVVLYYSGVGVVPKVSDRQRKAGLSTILIQVDVVLALIWIRR